MAYNPYKTVKTISELKGKYHTAKELGQDPSRYQEEAVQYYNELRNNGQVDLADRLTKADYIGSRDILAGLTEPRPYDDWYDSITSKKIEEASNPVRSETADRIFSAYDRNNELLNGAVSRDANGNVVSGLNVDHYNTGKNQLGYINDYDITKQNWYDDLMAGYSLQGSDASKGALAAGASGNSGNIDSYAAANANRQKLAFTNAGNEAARALAAQNMAAWQQLYDSMTGHLGTMGAQNNEALGIGAQVYATDAAERQNALNQAAGLEAQRMQNYINEYMAGLEADTAQHKADQALQEAYAQAEASKYGHNKDYEAAVYANDIQKQIADAELYAQLNANGQITFDMVKELLNEEYKKFENGTSPYKNLNELYEDYAKDFGEFSDEIYAYLKDARTRQQWLEENS